MNFLIYLLSLIFIYPISLLPFSLLYIISDFCYVIIYKMIGYRKDVVFKNLKNAFPDKSNNDIKIIADKYYKHLCDLLVETLKTYSISASTLRKRCPVTNPEEFQKYYDQGQSIVIATAHYGNWEWAAQSTALYCPHKLRAVYQPLKNPYFDKLMRRNRRKFGTTMIPANKVSKFLRSSKQPTGTVFLGDQSPGNPSKSYWTTFLNQDTPVNTAIEKFAVITEQPVIFGKIIKKKRGYYEIILTDLKQDSSEVIPGEIAETYSQVLGNLIKQEPAYWLWSHRRWKHKRK